MEAKNVTILGSTGSIGESTLDVIRQSEKFNVFALTANRNSEKLLVQCKEFNPAFAVLADESLADPLRSKLSEAGLDTQLMTGAEALVSVATNENVDMVMAAIVGAAGLSSSLAAANSGKRLLLANKESLVMSGDLIVSTAADSGAEIIPIDSEHNAIFQCLPGSSSGVKKGQLAHVSKVALTASGGPFLNLPQEELVNVTPEQACKHPRWDMGRKISVDSATMMNKGLEFIEACYLFQLQPQEVEVLIHPESIVHSLVYYQDGSVLAQLANPDMRVPIANGLAYPERIEIATEALDLAKIGSLNFREPDLSHFPCLRLGMEAAKAGGTAPAILNAANEIAVEAFLQRRIRFSEISLIIEEVMSKIPCEPALSLAIIQDIDRRARSLSNDLILKEF